MSPWRYLGFTIWPILNDEGSQIEFYDIMAPCRDPLHERPEVRCDCAIAEDPEAMAGSPEEARQIIQHLASERRFFRRAFGEDLYGRR